VTGVKKLPSDAEGPVSDAATNHQPDSPEEENDYAG
jgi:hypothetical protein